MSKKSKHQKELIENKLNNTTKELNQLETKYDTLILNLKTLISPHLLLQKPYSNKTFKLNTTLQTLLYEKNQEYNNNTNNNTNNNNTNNNTNNNNTNNNTNNNNINNNTNYTISKLNYEYLNTELTLLEQEKQTNKQLISGLTKNNNELENNIRSSKDYVPDTLLNKIKNEELILKDELERITIETEEKQQLHKITISKAYNNKITLENDINLLKLEIKENNYSMEELKQYLHSSRKNTLSQLIQNKQTKLKLNEEKINNIKTINDYTEQINKLNLHNKQLEELKKNSIDIEYNTNNIDYITNNDILQNTLTEYNTKFNIDINLSFTEKINYCDGLIECNTNEINYITKKMNKFKLMNDTMLNEITTLSSPKNITYKNDFKYYKEKKKSLDIKLSNLIYNYNNYESIVIDKINKEFDLHYNELTRDKLNAYKRLTTVKERIEKERQETIFKMIDTINNNKITIKQSENNIITISQCIKDLHFYITNEKNITKEITSITDTINKYKSIIQHYKEELKFIN